MRLRSMVKLPRGWPLDRRPEDSQASGARAPLPSAAVANPVKGPIAQGARMHDRPVAQPRESRVSLTGLGAEATLWSRGTAWSAGKFHRSGPEGSMYDQLFETYRKSSESWLQMQQDTFKNMVQQWTAAPQNAAAG